MNICPSCGSNLTSKNSIRREYINKDAADENDTEHPSTFSTGHYEKDSRGDTYFEPDQPAFLQKGRFDLVDNSDTCIKCDTIIQ
jgi:hypothetical protein